MVTRNKKGKIIVFADGSSLGNPGPGGWGVVILSDGAVIELGGSEAHTTNNQMELTAAIRALEELETTEEILLHTDSSYVINGITKWIYAWRKNNWRTQASKEVLNRELWETLYSLSTEKDVNWVYVSGHSGIPGNERADQIARTFAEKAPEVSSADLYRGDASHYKIDLTDVASHSTKLAARKKDRAHSRAKAYSYVSEVGGKVQIHTTWPECEKRVKGARGARFKKTTSAEEERAIVHEWRK